MIRGAGPFQHQIRTLVKSAEIPEGDRKSGKLADFWGEAPDTSQVYDEVWLRLSEPGGLLGFGADAELRPSYMPSGG